MADVIDVDGDGTTNLGDIIKYTFEITNTGNSSLNSFTLVDNLTSISGSTLTNSITIVESSTNLLTKSNFYNGWTQAGTQHFAFDYIPDQIMYYFTSSSGLTSAQVGDALVDGKNYVDYTGNSNGQTALDAQAKARRIKSTGGAAPMYYQNFNFILFQQQLQPQPLLHGAESLLQQQNVNVCQLHQKLLPLDLKRHLLFPVVE